MARAVRRLGGPSLVAAIVIAVDQLTKHWALNALAQRDIDLVGPLRFNLAFNTGMAFSSGAGMGRWIGLIALVVVGVLFRIVAAPGATRLQRVAAGLIAGGALGNVVDRLFRGSRWMDGAVVDFIDVQFWPIFNVADVAVVVGAALLVLATVVAPAGDEPAHAGSTSGSSPVGATDQPAGSDQAGSDQAGSDQQVGFDTTPRIDGQQREGDRR